MKKKAPPPKLAVPISVAGLPEKVKCGHHHRRKKPIPPAEKTFRACKEITAAVIGNRCDP